MISLSPQTTVELIGLFEDAADIPALSGDAWLSGIPATTLRSRLRNIPPSVLEPWLVRIGYAGTYETTFEDAPEWVDLEPTEDPERLRYRDPESLRWQQLPIAEAEVYRIDPQQFLTAIADMLSVPATQRDGIDRPLIDDVLWKLGTARLGAGLNISAYVVRTLDAHFETVVSRLSEEQRAGIVLNCSPSTSKWLRWPAGITVVSLANFLVPERSRTMLDLQRLARRVSESPDDPLDDEHCPVQYDADMKMLTITGKEPWVVKGPAQARAVEFMAKRFRQGVSSVRAEDILKASRAPGQIGGARTVPDLFKKNPKWTQYIERKEYAHYGFKLE